MIALLWTACAPPPPPGPGVRVERAVALSDEVAWVDVVDDAGAALRCRLVGERPERCAPRAPGPSGLRRLGDRLIEERTSAATAPATRSAAWVDPETGAASEEIDLGFEIGALVAGDGPLVAGPEGLLISVANRGLSGAPCVADDPAGVEALAAFAVEAWDGGQLRWRRAIAGTPGELWARGDLVLAQGGGRWRIFDARTGRRIAEVPGVAGACVDERFLWTLDGGSVAKVELGTGRVERTPLAVPGWVASCVVRDGEPVFHGGTDRAEGWLLGPAFPLMRVPRVDLALHDHVAADGSWWVNEQLRGLVIVDPAARSVRGQHDAVHNVVGGLLWFDIAADAGLEMTLHTSTATTSLPARITPLRDHVADGVLWTFPLRAELEGSWADRLRLPELVPAESRGGG